MKFKENPSGGSRVVPCGRTDTTKQILDFRKFSNGSNKSTKTPMKFITIPPISSTHWDVLQLWKSSDKPENALRQVSALRSCCLDKTNKKTDHENELVDIDGNYSGLCFEGDCFECQVKHGLFWKFFIYFQDISVGNANQATNAFFF